MPTLTDALHEYFRGERNLGFALAAYGVFLLAAAAWVWRTQDGAFATALLVPLAVLGVLFGGGGTFLALKTPPQVEKLEADLKAQEKPALDAELARMAKVNANWPRVKLAWAVVTLVALVLLLAVKRDWASGLGLALFMMITPLFFTDVFAERRAEPYTRALEAARRLHTP